MQPLVRTHFNAKRNLLRSTLVASALAAGCTYGPYDGQLNLAQTNAGSTYTMQGIYPNPNIQIHMEVLDQPDSANPTWVAVPGAVGTTSSTGTGSPPYYDWSLSGIPVPPNTAAQRWPQGGMARIRAVANDPNGLGAAYPLMFADENGQACGQKYANQNWQTIVSYCGRASKLGQALVSDHPSPADNANPPPYLTAPVNVATATYYQVINPPPDLETFKTNNGFKDPSSTLASATYYNEGDLGIGRNMNCAQKVNGDVACFVSNFAPKSNSGPAPVIFGDEVNSMALATGGGSPFATVAMTYTPSDVKNTIKFMVYGADNKIYSGDVYLDSKGVNHTMPGNCMACHGGAGSWSNNSLTGAHFLPFDVFNSLHFGNNYPNDAESFRKLNNMVVHAGPTTGINDWITKMYPGGVGNVGSTPVNTYQPADWASKGDDIQGLYTTMVAPYCRTCHTAQPNLDFTTYDQLISYPNLGDIICKSHLMPHAEHTHRNFWASASRAHLTRLLKYPGTCTPN